jgi:hypothetical protein
VRQATKKPTKKERVRELAASRGWAQIGDAEWHELRAALPDVSEATIREAGLEISPPWCGVRQHSLDELEGSLDGFTAVYESRPDLRQSCREQVIEAKDHARWASRSQRLDPERRVLKAEMVEWMLVWLDDPSLFPAWAKLRRDKIENCSNT